MEERKDINILKVVLAEKERTGALADLCGVSHNDDGYSNKDEYFEERGYYKANQTLDYDSLGWVQSLDYPIEIKGEVFYAGGSKEEYEKRQRGMHGRADWRWRLKYGKVDSFDELMTLVK